MPDKKKEGRPDKMPARLSEYMPETNAKKMQEMPDRMPERMSEYMRETNASAAWAHTRSSRTHARKNVTIYARKNAR